MIINSDNPNIRQEIEQFLSDSDIQPENIPVTIIVNPPILAVFENAARLSEILIQLLDKYRTRGDYFLDLRKFAPGIAVAFGIKHSGTSVSTEIGHC